MKTKNLNNKNDLLTTTMKCYKCSHKWEYKGKSKIYITCPQCYCKIKRDKANV